MKQLLLPVVWRTQSSVRVRPYLGLLAVLLSLGTQAQAQLTVTSTSPAHTTNLAPRPTNVALTYSQPLTASNTPAVRVFSRQAGGRKAGSISTGGSTLTVNPSVDFKPGETVSVTSVGSTSVAPYVYQFTTRTDAGPGTFNGGSEVSVGRGPRGVIAADIDGDGDLDLLMANDIDNMVSVRLNNGQGSFTSNGQDVNADTPNSIAAADVDGDGDLDLLVTNEYGGSVSVRLNNGAGTFSNAPDVAVGISPRTLAVADIDGDGDVDLLTGNYRSPNSVSVRLNQVPSPIISGVTPSVGVAGTRVTITGVNFTGATSVAFNGVAATVFTVNSATELVARRTLKGLRL